MKIAKKNKSLYGRTINIMWLSISDNKKCCFLYDTIQLMKIVCE